MDQPLDSGQSAEVVEILPPLAVMAISGVLYLLARSTASSLERRATNGPFASGDPGFPGGTKRAMKDERGKARVALALFVIAAVVLVVRLAQLMV